MTNSKSNQTGSRIAAVTLLLIFQQLASKVGSLFADCFDYRAIDEYDIFAHVSVHHIVQMLIALSAIILFSKKYKIDFGFKAGDKKSGINSVLYLLGYSLSCLAVVRGENTLN